MEPILVEQHSDYLDQADLDVRHVIFRCSNGYGLSAVTCASSLPNVSCGSDSYEVILISHVSDDGLSYLVELDGQPKGWLSVQEIGFLVDQIEKHGRDGYSLSDKPPVFD